MGSELKQGPYNRYLYTEIKKQKFYELLRY